MLEMLDIDTKIFEQVAAKFHLTHPLRIHQFASGQVNRVYELNEQLVVKIQGIREGEPDHIIEHQPAVLEKLELAGAKISSLLEFGEVDRTKYLVLKKLPGSNLIYLWPQANAAEQDRYIGQIAEQMKLFHSIKSPKYQIPIASGVPQDNLQEALAGDTDFAGIDKTKLEAKYQDDYDLLREFYASRQSLLNENGTAVFVHNDLHFENVFFDGNRLSGIIDFDWCAYGPKDLELKKLLDFVHSPHHYVENSLQPIYKDRQETQVIHILRRHYPTLFETAHLIDRVRMYETGILLWTISGFLSGRWSKDTIKNVHQRVNDFFRNDWLEQTLFG
jgi:aminoglycoside phosphotransferase (APT) family kinase protein